MSSTLFNKYIHKHNILNKLDPRTKIFFTIFYFISIFSANTLLEFLILIIPFALLIYYSEVNLPYLLKSFKVVFILVIFTSVIHIILNNQGFKIITLLGFSIYSGAIFSILLISIRFFLVVLTMVIFNITTSPTDITYAINKSLKFLSKIGFDVDSFSLIVSISLRFIPTILEETDRIINSQVSRGANLKSGNFVSRIKNFIPILIPIFISTLKRADELAIAMEIRGYIPNKKRTRYKELKYNTVDYFIYIFIIFISLFIFIY